MIKMPFVDVNPQFFSLVGNQFCVRMLEYGVYISKNVLVTIFLVSDGLQVNQVDE